MAERRLATYVHVHEYDKDGNVTGSTAYGPDDKIPAEVAKTLGDHVWAKDEDAGPSAPAGNASLEAWQDHALFTGATTDDIDGMTRDELREQFGA